MIRTSKFFPPVLPWVAAAALVCSVALLGSNGARAQKAGNLNCKKCVDTRDIAKKAITKSRIKKGAVKKTRLTTDLQEHVDGREPFYITLDGDNSTATIATHGPLRYFARCRINQPDGGGGFEDRIEIVATSSADGWFEGFFDSPDTPLSAGQELIVSNLPFNGRVNPSGGAYYSELTETAMVAPDGSYMALEGDGGGMGLNIFGHDCLAVGNIYRNTGTL